MADSPLLGLPYLDQAQAQKHVTHNEALRILDALVQASVLDRDLAVPPALPAAGARYLVPSGASGAFAGQTGRIAAFDDDAWRFLAPREGWCVQVADEDLALVYDGAAWVPLGRLIGEAQNLSGLGLGASSDAANAFVARLRNALFFAVPPASGGDGDVQLKLSRTTSADIASLLFQTDFSGRAELGLTGDDHLRVKVSPDGTAWAEGLVINSGTGKVSFPNGAEAPDGLARSATEVFTSSGSWTKPAWARWVQVTAIGGGGGGGAGRRSASGTNAGGGAGGAAGHVVERLVPANLLAASIPVTIGGGGNGAAAVGDSTNGGAGAQGSLTSFGNAVWASGGRGGSGGTTSSAGTAVPFVAAGFPMNTEAYGGGGGATGAGATGGYSARGPGGGGGGGFLNTAGTEAAGGAGGIGDYTTGTRPTAGSGGSVALPDGGAGGAGTLGGGSGNSGGGGGGGGGASKSAAAAGSGGSGGAHGAGGGGGGGGRNGQSGGAGGNGAAGLVIVTAIG